MSWDIAFLRGINLGKRQIKMAALAACLEASGYAEVRTILASGNIRFRHRGDNEATRIELESLIETQFGFKVGVIMRSEAQIRLMLAEHPFGALDPAADLTCHVLLFQAPLPTGLTLEGIAGHTEILRVDPREIYIAGYRQPNGRYTEGVDAVLKPLYARLGRDVLGTMRNWNTVQKVIP